jgi:hypothetical protein
VVHEVVNSFISELHTDFLILIHSFSSLGLGEIAHEYREISQHEFNEFQIILSHTCDKQENCDEA